MSYTHLTRHERYQIYILKRAGHSQSAIATLMNRHKATISRELARNSGQRGYRPGQAHRLAVARVRTTANARRIAPATWAFAQARLGEQWSPEQISGFLKIQGLPGVSHETLYQRIYVDKRSGGHLWRHLRCQKLRRKRYGRHDRRGTMPGRVSIEQRPPIVEARTRVGHWEGDTIVGANHRQALVSLVERKSRYTLLTKVERKTAELVGRAVTGLLKPFKARVHSLTTDNGREFAEHQAISHKLDADFYFAHPYASWERGSCENTNGLVRQYFPKKHRFDTIQPEEVRLVMERLNHRPRKCLGFRTPHEVFMQSFRRVALQG